MSAQSRWAAPRGPDAAQKAAQRAARFSSPAAAQSNNNNNNKTSSQQLDLLLSPSRGELAHEKSLRDPAVQAEYYEHLQGKVEQFTRRFSFQDAWEPGEPQDVLRNICLDFRKLREGLLAAGRTDAFAVSVYQQAVDLACYAQHAATLTTALPSLLHLYTEKSIDESLSNLSLVHHQSTSQRHRKDQDSPALYASLHLLHLLSSTLPGAHARFCDAFKDLTFTPPSSSIYAKRQFVTVDAHHPHFQLAKRAFQAIHRRDWVAFRKLAPTDWRQSLLLKALERQVRDAAWDVLVLGYQMLPSSWLQKQLMLSEDHLQQKLFHDFLSQHGRAEVDRVVQLKIKATPAG